MLPFNSENHAKNLPSIYKSDSNSNNFKLLEVERSQGETLRESLQSIDAILDLDNAKGKTLELYGERVGQARGQATDEQYLYLIKARIMRNLSNGSYESIIQALCATFNCEPSEISIIEKDEPCVVESINLPLSTLARAGLSLTQANALIKALMPVGVRLETAMLEGTFAFADSEGEYDENAGFCDVEGGTKGGYLGSLGTDTNEPILPI